MGVAGQASNSGAAVSSSSVAAATMSAPSDTVEQMKGPVYQAAKVGFDVNAYISPKDSAVVEVWMITKVTDGKFTIAEQNLPNEGRSQDISASECMAKWRLSKGKVTQMLPANDDTVDVIPVGHGCSARCNCDRIARRIG